ncbi:hypothetical protein SNOG_11352 [Parastagonospora nodorum SN15]|uniref:Uncharacterized protein n=1 Tax=Phaeosphaeria nodorum (strain SN15 / ATCC MYA-4574 / FGSC 10173) TaxID=321614 RepID=Q0UA62_PHANO|nr:hypothetical protein SNOG_11352 [Parastagonospora nodorum SN15]EAT81060.1 hypothetical protein SNOG_11352 [Parastagonospora nodorum SN15]
MSCVESSQCCWLECWSGVLSAQCSRAATLSPTTSRASRIVPTCRLHGNPIVGEQNPPDIAMLLHVLLAHDLFGPIYPCITGSNLLTRAVDATSTSTPTPSQESPRQSVPDVKRSTRAPEHKQGTPRREKGSATQRNDVAQLSPCLSRSMAVAMMRAEKITPAGILLHRKHAVT